MQFLIWRFKILKYYEKIGDSFFNPGIVNNFQSMTSETETMKKIKKYI